MRNRIVLLAFVLLLFSIVTAIVFVESIGAQDRTVGVSPGDWAEYAITYSGNMTLPSPESRAEWSKLIVQEVSNTTIVYEVSVRFADSSEKEETAVLDVVTGQGNGTGTFIAANLNEGDIIYTSPPAPWEYEFQGARMNETIFKTYLGESVEINHLIVKPRTRDNPLGNGTMTNYINAYWYKASGILAEFSVYELYQYENGTITWIKGETTIVAVIPEFSSLLILPLFMIITLLAVIIYRREHST